MELSKNLVLFILDQSSKTISGKTIFVSVHTGTSLVGFGLITVILIFSFYHIIFPRCNLNIYDIIDFTDAGLQVRVRDDNPFNGPAVQQGNMG